MFPYGLPGITDGADEDLGNSWYHADPSNNPAFACDKGLQQIRFFDPPMRILRHRVIDFQISTWDWVLDNSLPLLSFFVSITYTEVPNHRKEYRT
jgi:hypothetical protein